MILFFRTPSKSVIATEIDHKPSQDEINELCWLYGDATLEDAQQLQGFYVGPRREMITPWSTNAVEITQNMSLNGISRIEEYLPSMINWPPKILWRQCSELICAKPKISLSVRGRPFSFSSLWR